jgi:hypothetical protein
MNRPDHHKMQYADLPGVYAFRPHLGVDGFDQDQNQPGHIYGCSLCEKIKTACPVCDPASPELSTLRAVLQQAGELIQTWAPKRYIDVRPTVEVLALAETAVDRMAVCLIALRDVPEALRFQGMGKEARILAREFLRLLEYYLRYFH